MKEMEDIFKLFEKEKTKKSEFETALFSKSRKIQDSLPNSEKNYSRKKINNYFHENNWGLWTALYNNSWLFRKAIDKPSQDIVNLKLKISNEENYSDIIKTISRLKSKLIELNMWGKLYGGAIAVMLFDNIPLEQMSSPLDEKKIKQSKKINLEIFDRWSNLTVDITELETNIMSLDFLKPKYYKIRIGNQEYKIHCSYCLRYENRPAPKIIKQGELMGWGYPEGVHLINEITRDEKIKESILSLIDKSLIEVIKMSGMRGVFMGADRGNEQQLTKRLEMVNWARNYNSLTFLDKDDEYQQNEFGGLSGLADLMNTNMETIAAALDMSGILFGDLSGGFSPDNYSLIRYNNFLLNSANSSYRPVIEKLIQTLKIKYNIEDEIEFEFVNIMEQYEDNIDKMSKVVNVVENMVDLGCLSVSNAAKEIQQFSNIYGIGKTITDEEIEKLEKNELENKENFDDEII